MDYTEILAKIKVSLRMKKSTNFDEDLTDHVNAAILDLKMTGVKNIKSNDPLIIQAIKYYCRSNFALDNKDSEKFRYSYENLRDKLALTGEYQINE